MAVRSAPDRPLLSTDRPDAVLSELVSTLRFSAGRYACSDLGAPWGIAFAARSSAIFHVVERGACWLRLGGEAPIALGPGELVLLPRGDEHALADEPDRSARLVDFDAQPDGRVRARGGAGARTRLVCGELRIDDRAAHPLLVGLPRVVHVRATVERGWLEPTLALIAAEASEPRSGASVVVARLSEALFVQAVRAWAEERGGGTGGWSGALRDPAVARALASIHAEPARPWTLDALARTAGVSRTLLAERFARTVGEPPGTYLVRWRMALAARALRDEPSASIADVAARVGYESESSFGRAFKRVHGTSPARHRSAHASRADAR